MRASKKFTHHAILGVMASVFLWNTFPANGNVTNAVHTVIKVAYMGKAVSNELVRISQDGTITTDIRQFAVNVLANHDHSGTNSYDEIAAFVTNWTMTAEPPMTTNTIAVMGKSLELGKSAFNRLQGYASDTNTPPYLREMAGRMVTNIIQNIGD
jgi:hypothetical protein